MDCAQLEKKVCNGNNFSNNSVFLTSFAKIRADSKLPIPTTHTDIPAEICQDYARTR